MRTVLFRCLLWTALTVVLHGEPSVTQQNPSAGIEQWLSAHPAVANAIVWQSIQETKAYPQWTLANKKRLANAVADAIANKPTGLPSVPANAFHLTDSDFVIQGLAPNDAFHLFLRYAAKSLALEITRGVPWSIARDTPAELAVLLDSRQMFSLIKDPIGQPVYEIYNHLFGRSLPAPPDRALRFLREHNLIGSSRLDTITRTLDWCKGMIHFTGGMDVKNMNNVWHYMGFPPATRVMECTAVGTQKADGGRPEFRHFTAGCHGTTGFLRSVLRSVNIPVINKMLVGEAVDEKGHKRSVNHSTPYFPTEGSYLTHGDDPYNLLWSTMYPPVPASELLIDQRRFDALFGPTVGLVGVAKNVGRRPSELAVRYLPIRLLSHYAEDLSTRKNHAEGSVYKNLKNGFTVEQLEGEDLWTRMDARITELGGVAKVRDLEATLAANSVCEDEKTR
ncbi:MAG: hypothetical protein M3N12_06645 [Verrucomicrobiota bacterium]|nr:hypothetical protein [Verrucomicrobiota bacterium]